MLDRQFFYDKSRILFGKISTLQFKGMEAILDEWEKQKLTDTRWLAYMMGTTYHETGKAMRPVEEGGRGKGHEYGIIDPVTHFAYYGRGLVQLTWGSNYKKMGKILGYDLYHHPDLALDLKISIEIMFEGMMRAESTFGDFTGKCLEMYFHDSVENWIEARRIINGLDRAVVVAMYAKTFNGALRLAA